MDINVIHYNGKDAKKKFITHICNDLQYMKKHLLRRYDFYDGIFELCDNKNPIERWEFEIKVEPQAFAVLKCRLLLNGKTIKYCCNPNEIITFYGRIIREDDNVFRNITEFREFLKREVLKEN